MRYRLLEDKDWGMRWAKPPVAQQMPVGEVYVHHTAGSDPTQPGGDDDDPATAFHNLNEYAINVKGYSATDYSMLVHTSPTRATTIGEARGQWLPAATKDRNTESKAVCLFGYFHPGSQWSRPPFEQELEAVAEAIVWMIGQGWVVADPLIRGHRDNPAHPGATACPGDYLQARLPRIRQLVADYQKKDPDMTVSYFRLAGPNPLTIWATSDWLIAVRLDPEQAAARGLPASIPILADNEAVKLSFISGLPNLSVK